MISYWCKIHEKKTGVIYLRTSHIIPHLYNLVPGQPRSVKFLRIWEWNMLTHLGMETLLNLKRRLVNVYLCMDSPF